jgi:hypothetical protein
MIVDFFAALLDPSLFLTTPFVFSGSSSGILPLHQPQVRLWWAIPRNRLAIPTPLARATMILPPTGLRRNAMKPDTSWKSSPKKAGIAELE